MATMSWLKHLHLRTVLKQHAIGHARHSWTQVCFGYFARHRTFERCMSGPLKRLAQVYVGIFGAGTISL